MYRTSIPCHIMSLQLVHFQEKILSVLDRFRGETQTLSHITSMRILPFIWLFLASAYCISMDAVLASQQCLSDQEQALLLELRNGLVFDASLSTKLVTWNRSSGLWYGVTCESGHVTGLDLSNESISDGIHSSSSLFRLQHLQALNLAYNFFNYSGIPSEFANLSNLVYLNLSNAGFGGSIPNAISQLRRLVTLDLSSIFVPDVNLLRHPNLKLLVGTLNELRELNLDGVKISLPGNEWCMALSSSLPKLEVLSMFDCHLSGPISPSLLHLQSLSVIPLGKNKLSTRIPEFIADFPNLTSLSLTFADIRGELPQKIIQLPKLQNLDLSYNSLLQGSLPEFPENSAIQTLILSFTAISGTLPYSIGSLQNLSRVEMINCNIHGQIPSSISNLSKLVYLDLSFNNLTGPIPSFSMSKNLTQITLSHNGLTGEITATRWEYLSELKELNLRNNSLEGRIPSSLFALPSIQKIELDSNKFSGRLDGSPNFSSCQLDTLELSNNYLEGPIPMPLFGLRQLKVLALSSNMFTGSLDLQQILQNSTLAHLDLSGNNLSIDDTSSASVIRSFPQMSVLKLAFCRLKIFPAFLSNQTGLIHLDLSNNELEGAIPKWISNLDNLSYLNLSYNLLEDNEMALHNLSAYLSVLDVHSNKLQGKLPRLPPSASYLDYSNNSFSSAIPDDIGFNMLETIFLSLSENRIHGRIPESICQGIYLKVLDLSNNYLTGPIPTCTFSLARYSESGVSLMVLNLRNNNLSGRIPDSFPETCTMISLDLLGNRLEGLLPMSLSNCQKLEVLDVGNNHITDVFPCQLKKISSLRVLILRSNRFWGTLACHDGCGSWEKLQIVDLANNNFNGDLPRDCLGTWKAMKANGDLHHIQVPFLELSGLYYQQAVTLTVKGFSVELVKILMVFTSIDLSNNRFEGPIPEEVGYLKALHLLNLSHNAFWGTIPSSLGNLQALESLDLSWNHLSGRIPPELSELNFLSTLNLSQNQLVGSIPASKQFLTFTASSYGGNAGLCGPPLTRTCLRTAKERETEEAESGSGILSAVSYWHFMIVGYAAGLGAAVAYLSFWSRGEKWLDAIAGKILLKALPLLRS